MTKSAKRFVAAYFLGSCLIMLVGVLTPSGTGPVLVVVAPWGASALEVVAKAEGRLMAAPETSWFAITEASSAAFVDRLYQAGATFVASSTVAIACARLTGLSSESQE